MDEDAMTWMVWLGLAVLIGLVATVTGLKPRGSRPVARTRLMGAARLVLAVLVLLFLYLAYRGYTAP